MINKSEKQALAEAGTSVYDDLETLLMQNIIRHVQHYDQLIDSDTWLLQKLAEIGRLNAENMKIISKAAGLSSNAVERMLKETVNLVLDRVEPGLDELKKEKLIEGAVPAKKSKNIEQAVKAVREQAKDSLNLCNTTMLYKARDAYKEVVQNTVSKAKEIENKQEFLDILGKHATAEAIGAESRQQAIKEVIQEFNNKGIPAFVDRKGREWTPEAYVSMTLRSTAGNTATGVMMARMEDHNLNLIQMSSHSGARPKCAKDQGRIFDKNNGSGYVEDLRGNKVRYYPLRDSSYGEPDGILGINCGHHCTPFLPGISMQRYFPTDDFAENDKLYKKMQVQRSLERDIRKQKRLCTLYDKAGDHEAFEQAAVKLKTKEAQMLNYLKSNGSLIRRPDREQVVGFDRGVSARTVGKAKTHYKNWAKSIGAESGPKTLAGYYDLKYNNSEESRLYKGYVDAVNNGRISPLVGYDNFKEKSRQIEKSLNNLKTSDGQKINGYTAHFVERMIGTHSGQLETDNKEMKKG